MSTTVTVIPVRDPRRVLRESFARPKSAALTVVATALALGVLVPFLRWALIDAKWRGTAADCRVEGVGACWAFIDHKLAFILFGLYPPAEHWRPALATGLLLFLVVATMMPLFWRRSLIGAWVIGFAFVLWLLGGGLLLSPVPSQEWGGLPITLILTTVGLGAGLP